MKIIQFIPSKYSIGNTVSYGFEKKGHQIITVDYYDFFSDLHNKFMGKTSGLSDKNARWWRPQYYDKINQKYLTIIEEEQPDLVFIYNNQFFFPETLKKIKDKTKICFFIGDNPLYSNTFDYNLTLLFLADVVISPDSFWTAQLNKIGLNNIYNDVIGYDPRINFKIEEPNDKKEWDLLFIGRNYRDAAGYKRSLFYSKFSEFNFELKGSHEWLKWLEYFPELKKNFSLKEKDYSLEEINLLTNKAKIYPIENNTGLFNGIHVRFFDTIGAGVLPLPEYSKDLDLYFKEIEVPSIKNYEEASLTVQYYLNNEQKTEQLLLSLRQYVKEQYLPEHFVDRLINRI